MLGHHHHHHWVVGDGDSRRIWGEMSRWRNAMMRALARALTGATVFAGRGWAVVSSQAAANRVIWFATAARTRVSPTPTGRFIVTYATARRTARYAFTAPSLLSVTACGATAVTPWEKETRTQQGLTGAQKRIFTWWLEYKMHADFRGNFKV